MPYGLKSQQLESVRCQVSIPHMGCMPYGLPNILVECVQVPVSIPHMGCMPYGHWSGEQLEWIGYMFQSLIWVACPTGWLGCVTIDLPYGSFNPSYGLHALRARPWPVQAEALGWFQSLIWVACPTGRISCKLFAGKLPFQSLIWVACPTGSGRRCASCLTQLFQSLIWVACPTGHTLL